MDFISNAPKSKGVPVSTDKVELYAGRRAYLITRIRMRRSIRSCPISKPEDSRQLYGHAGDSITCGMAIEEFIPKDYWRTNP